ncbi:putative membrane protein ycf78 [Frankliniella fusca]|uniref:Membrane protein ycf78 n=1 Tax=Frankliniella fusca TaxID=407009 RepID=A0AAE1GVU3_9NEOP|nr:putative membrane protein ycf78 [Frankliniella fusca]
MSNIILVQHFSGYPNDDPASVSRVSTPFTCVFLANFRVLPVLQCGVRMFPFGFVFNVSPSVTPFRIGPPSHLPMSNSTQWSLLRFSTVAGFTAAGFAESPATWFYVSDNPMPHWVLEQFPEPRVIELIPPAHQQHPAPAIMAGFYFYGFELPLELQSDDEASDAESDSSLSSDDCDSALEADSDSVSSRW